MIVEEKEEGINMGVDEVVEKEEERKEVEVKEVTKEEGWMREEEKMHEEKDLNGFIEEMAKKEDSFNLSENEGIMDTDEGIMSVDEVKDNQCEVDIKGK